MARNSALLIIVYATVVLAIASMALKSQPAVISSIVIGFAAGLRLLLTKK